MMLYLIQSESQTLPLSSSLFHFSSNEFQMADLILVQMILVCLMDRLLYNNNNNNT